MEPLSALGVASNVVQFVDFASKVVSETARIYHGRARRDAEDERSELERVTNDLEDFNKNLTSSLQSHRNQWQVSQEDKEIIRICADCAKISSKLLAALNTLNPSKVTVWKSFAAALRSIWSEGEIQALRQTLDSYRQQISLYLLAAVR
jgi:Xaa-Pro aminopeptidase